MAAGFHKHADDRVTPRREKIVLEDLFLTTARVHHARLAALHGEKTMVMELSR
jgi:hypothetical protein